MNNRLKQAIITAYNTFPIQVTPIQKNDACIGHRYYISPEEAKGIQLCASYDTVNVRGDALPAAVRGSLNLSLEFWDHFFQHENYCERVSVYDYMMPDGVPGRSPLQNDMMDIYRVASDAAARQVKSKKDKRCDEVAQIIEDWINTRER